MGVVHGDGFEKQDFMAGVALAAPALASEPLVGRASVVDGDTIDIHNERVRFNGIDAPESWQRCEDAGGVEYHCGKASAEALDAFLAQSRPTRCDFIERDRYGRFVGNCYRADGASVAEFMVRSGWALDWPRYSDGAYAREQDRAKAERSGMWQGRFVSPWEARANR